MAPSTENLPAMRTNPKFIFFTDFDGTITTRDSNDYLTDNLGYGQTQRKAGNRAVLDGSMAFRDSFQEMLDSINTPFDECIKVLIENIQLDPYFKEFYDWARSVNMPVVVLSGGMEPIIRALLEHMIGEDAKDIQIVSNDVVARPGKNINEEGGWTITFHDETHVTKISHPCLIRANILYRSFGHDKSLEIRPYAALPEAKRPTMFYAGDGVSDLSAAKETDLLFAKEGHDLVLWCVKEKVPFTLFRDWSSILSTCKTIVNNEVSVKDVAAAGVQEATEQ